MDAVLLRARIRQSAIRKERRQAFPGCLGSAADRSACFFESRASRFRRVARRLLRLSKAVACRFRALFHHFLDGFRRRVAYGPLQWWLLLFLGQSAFRRRTGRLGCLLLLLSAERTVECRGDCELSTLALAGRGHVAINGATGVWAGFCECCNAIELGDCIRRAGLVHNTIIAGVRPRTFDA